jgi:2-octaprenyl-6-methoxyphenol hydroxylase
LRDAAVLASLLAQASSPEKLAQFIASRGSDRNITMQLTDAMARAFASAPDKSFTQDLLGLSLGLVDVLPRLRRGLAEQMMFGWR